LGLGILKKEQQEVPRRWDNDYIISLLRNKVPELNGAKRREMVRQHVDELQSSANEIVQIDLNKPFLKESLFIFSEGVKAYTER